MQRRLRRLGTTVFAEMSALAEATGAINLGQGFPDEDGPSEVSEAIAQMIIPGSSLIISDQGLGDETGEGTDIIVVTR